MATIRYLVTDVELAIGFYTSHLGFKLVEQMGAAFAIVAKDDLSLWLSGPPSSAARPMPDGRKPESGGWNRLVVQVDDIETPVASMKSAGVKFRNDILSGPGGKQILAEDPDGNPIEIFQPASHSPNLQRSSSVDDSEIRALYQQMLDGWNNRQADDIARLYIEDGEVIGYDGSQMIGRAEIAATLRAIFADHPTATYISKVRTVRFLTDGSAILRAVVGMVPRGGANLNPNVNAIQTLQAVKGTDGWRIALFQNTPAQFHGRPELAQQLTDELKAFLPANKD